MILCGIQGFKLILLQISYKMKKTLQLLIFLMLAVPSLQAQDVSFGTSSFDYSFGIVENSIQLPMSLTNNGTEAITYAWKLEFSDNFPEEWRVQVCDGITCWNWGNEEQPDVSGLNDLMPGETTATALEYIKVANYQSTGSGGISGEGSVQLCLYSSFDFTQEPFACSDMVSTSSVDLESLSEIKLFPNPTNDYFEVSSDQKIASVELYDIVGKKVLSTSYTGGKQVDVSELRNGLYVVRLIDTQGKQLKTLRLSKR